MYAHFVTKFAENFPSFDSKRSESELRCWEDYWDSVTTVQRITNCSDMILVYLIKDSAAFGSELGARLRDITHTGGDGYTDISDIGLDGIRGRMLKTLDQKGTTWHTKRGSDMRILEGSSKRGRSGS